MTATLIEACFRIRDLTVRAGGRAILDGLTLEVPPHAVTGVIGPNGAGKSTFLSCLYRHLKYDGQIDLDGQNIAEMSRRELARRVAAVPQETPLAFDLTVEEVVSAGRTPHLSAAGYLRASDQDLTRRALAKVGLTSMAARSVATLSGGERQRTFLARALCQESPVLLLDEPTNHLDLANQDQLLELVHQHAGTRIIAIHDLNLAAEHCDHLIVLAAGKLVAQGPPEEVITPELLTRVFGVNATIISHPVSGRPHILTRPRN